MAGDHRTTQHRGCTGARRARAGETHKTGGAWSSGTDRSQLRRMLNKKKAEKNHPQFL